MASIYYKATMKRKVDYLIVGQGLAGTWLSFLLSKQKKNVLIVDKPLAGAASICAAGIFSPLTGKRAATCWRAAELLELAARLYPLIQQAIGFKVYYQLPIVRVFKDMDEKNMWIVKSQDKATARWLSPEIQRDTIPSCIHAPHGVMRVLDTGYVHTARLVTKYREAALAQGWMIEAEFDPAELKSGEEGMIWRNIEAANVIFCEGHRARKNPWFGRLPFQPTKGETITVKLEETVLRRIFHQGHYLVPLSDHTVKVGATYDREDLDPTPTPQTLKTLALSVANLVHLDIEVTKHEAGIRPNMLGHFPVVGRHPREPRMSIMNGMGSKGVLFAPFCAAALAAHLIDGTALPPEIDLARFKVNL